MTETTTPLVQNDKTLEGLSGKLMLAHLQSALGKAAEGMDAAPATREQVAEQVKSYLSDILQKNSIEPKVRIQGQMPNGGVIVDVELPVGLIPEEYLVKTHDYLLLIPHKGKVVEALSNLPDEVQAHYRQRMTPTLRGWYAHSHKGRTKRQHRLKAPAWLVDLGPRYKLRELHPDYQIKPTE